MATRLRCTSQNGLLVLTLESDDGLSRIQRQNLAEIARCVEQLNAEREASGCVLTGTERAFAVGADIAELARLSAAEAFEFSREGQRAMRLIERSRLSIVAAIGGYCIGGGLDLALACHARIATPDAVFAHPGGALGILTGWGGTQRLTRLIGRARALEMFSTGQRLTAQQALEFGLLRRIAPPSELIDVAASLVAALPNTVARA